MNGSYAVYTPQPRPQLSPHLPDPLLFYEDPGKSGACTQGGQTVWGGVGGDFLLGFKSSFFGWRSQDEPITHASSSPSRVYLFRCHWPGWGALIHKLSQSCLVPVCWPPGQGGKLGHPVCCTTLPEKRKGDHAQQLTAGGEVPGQVRSQEAQQASLQETEESFPPFLF